MTLRFDGSPPADLRAPGAYTRLDGSPGDLLAPVPTATYDPWSLDLEAMTFADGATSAAPTTVLLRLPIPPDTIKISEIQFQVALWDTASDDEVSCGVAALLQGNDTPVPHHLSGWDADGTIVQANATPLMLLVWTSAPLTAGVTRSYQLRVNQGRSAAPLGGGVPDYTFYPNGARFEVTSNGKSIKLVNALWRYMAGGFTPYRCDPALSFVLSSYTTPQVLTNAFQYLSQYLIAAVEFRTTVGSAPHDVLFLDSPLIPAGTATVAAGQWGSARVSVSSANAYTVAWATNGGAGYASEAAALAALPAIPSGEGGVGYLTVQASASHAWTAGTDGFAVSGGASVGNPAQTAHFTDTVDRVYCPFALYQRTDTLAFEVDTTFDRYGPYQSTELAPIAYVARFKLGFPPNTTWRPGVDLLSALDVTLADPGATSSTELSRAAPPHALDNAPTLIESFMLPASSTTALREASATYLCGTRLLSESTPIPVHARLGWSDASNRAPDVTWDHNGLRAFCFDRTPIGRLYCDVSSSSASYNPAMLWAQRYLETASPAWWHRIAQSALCFDKTYFNGGYPTPSVPVSCAGMFAVAYVFTGRTRFRDVARDMTTWMTQFFLIAGTDGSHSIERRREAFGIEGLTYCDWLGFSVPAEYLYDGSSTMAPTTIGSWKARIQQWYSIARNKMTLTGAQAGRTPSQDYIALSGYTGPSYDYTGNAVSYTPKPYQAFMVWAALRQAQYLSARRWSASERATFRTNTRADMALAMTFLLAGDGVIPPAYRGSPLDGSPKRPLGADEGFRYTTEESYGEFGAGAAAATAKAGAIAAGTARYFDAALGHFVATSNAAQATHALLEGVSSPYPALGGYYLDCLALLADTATTTAERAQWRRLALYVWQGQAGYTLNNTDFSFDGTGGRVTLYGPAKYYGENFMRMHQGSALVANIITNGI